MLVQSTKCLLTAVLLIGQLAMAPGDKPSDITITLTRISPVQAPQGTPFLFKVTARNTGTQNESPSIVIQLTNPLGSSRDIRSWNPEIAPGKTMTKRFSEVSSQWFEETGAFTVKAKVDGIVTGNSLTPVANSPRVTVPLFQDVTSSVGMDTILPTDTNTSHSNGAAWGDVNDDGYLDLYVPLRDQPAQLWVFHPELGKFQDDAAAWGVTNPGGKGVSAVFADYNNDGDEDLYVVNDAIDPGTLLPTGQGNRLFQNQLAQDQAIFTDVSVAARVGTQGNGASASWGDYDGDGLLDLYTVSNNAYNVERHGPYITYYQQDHLYHNDGDGAFTDVTCDSLPSSDSRSGFCPEDPTMGGSVGSGFQAVWIDYDLDGDVDLYVAQDILKALPHNDINRLYRNDGFDPSAGTWKFSDLCAESPTRAECLRINSMGVAVGDFNNDLRPDLAISNAGYHGGNVLLRNNDDGTFTNVAAASGIDRPLQTAFVYSVTWGIGFFDFNLDGYEDLYVVAGALRQRFDQPNQLFVNTATSTFLDLSAPSHAADAGVGHGASFADYDRDGRVDIYVVNADGIPGGPSLPILYRNITATGGHWLEVRLIGTASVRDACGARVILTQVAQQAGWVMCGSSLGAGDDTVVHFGGIGVEDLTLDIDWPSGGHQSLQLQGVDRMVTVVEA